jgi:hypothetical protein
MISARPADSRRRLLTLTYPAISAETRNLVGCAAASVPYSSRRFSGPETWPCLPCFEERSRSGVRQVVALPSKYRSRPAVSLCGPDDLLTTKRRDRLLGSDFDPRA